MSYMRSIDSDVLQEFGRLMQEKEGLKKVAQVVAPLSDEEKTKLQQALMEFVKTPANGPGMERWISRLNGQTDPYLKQVHDALTKRHSLWAEGKDSKEIAAIPLPTVANASFKIAEQKAYDVSGKEDLVQKAHPQTAKVEGDVVENLNEQQEADKAVAEKSANILRALYKLAKRLKTEGNQQAYKLVKETFLDLSKSFKK